MMAGFPAPSRRRNKRLAVELKVLQQQLIAPAQGGVGHALLQILKEAWQAAPARARFHEPLPPELLPALLLFRVQALRVGYRIWLAVLRFYRKGI